jgi:hypothetical protein
VFKKNISFLFHILRILLRKRFNAIVDKMIDRPSTLLGAVVLLLGYLCYYIYRTYSRLKDVPGPFWAKYTNLQRVLWVKTGRSQDIYQYLHQVYHDFVRIGPNMVSISDPAAIPDVYPMRPGFPKVGICLKNSSTLLRIFDLPI